MPEKFDRADKVLVAQGHFPSRAAAQAAIKAGTVSLAGRVVSRASEKIAHDAALVAAPAHPWVSRAGQKLDHALGEFQLDVSGANGLDIGASTGGFTQVLLARGARHVVSVDVGHGQLHDTLAADARVTSLEGTDARTLVAGDIGFVPDIIVCDASFISLAKLLGPVLALAGPQTRLVTLFKPQFEVGRAHVGKGGIVNDPAAVAQAETAFAAWLAGQGWQVLARADSPITGGDGNRERLVLAAPA